MPWTIELCDLEQTVLANLDDRLPGTSVELGRHAARLCSIDLSLSDPASELVTTGDTVLRVTDPAWTDPVFCGRVNTRNVGYDAESDSLRITASDPLPDLGRKVIRLFDTVSAPDAFIWRGYAINSQPADLMGDLIDDHAADMGVAIGTTPGGATVRTLTFPLGTTVLDGLLSLTGMDDSVEFELTPTEATDGTLVTFNAYYPQQGSDLTATVTLQIGVDTTDNLLDFSYEEALADMVNRHLAIGDVIGTATRSGLEYPLHYLYIAEHAGSVAQYGAFESSTSASGTTDGTVLQDLAKAVVAANAFPVTEFSATLDPTSALEFSPDGDFWMGDLLSLEAALPLETMLLEGRVAAATLTEEENGEITTAISCEPDATSSVTGAIWYALIDAGDGTPPPPPETPPDAGSDGGKVLCNGKAKPSKKSAGKGRKWVCRPSGWVRVPK